MPQVLARAPDGRLVFGWCPACLDREGCEPVGADAEALALSATAREPLGRRLRRLRRSLRRWRRPPRSPAAGRRLAAMGIAGLMAAWALILAFAAGLKLIGAGDGKGPMFLIGSGAMALVSLLVWVGVLGRSDGATVVLRVVQVASAIAALGTIAWGVSRNDGAKAPWFVAIAAGALALSWTARTIQARRSSARREVGRAKRTVA